MKYDVIIAGAGGAGLMAAATAGQQGARVLLIDHAEKAGKKILISGGGRCNFTNMGIAPECYISENPHFAKSALSRYTQWDFLALIEKYKIAWHEKTLGQLFCDGSARQVVAMLLEECDKGRVDVQLGRALGSIEHRDGSFHVGDAQAPNFVVATGGPSIPKMGATGVAYDIATKFGVNVITPRPALVPFTLGDEDADFRGISGVSFPSVATAGGKEFAEAALFTHRGLSGPSILQVSSYWQAGDAVTLSILPGAKEKLRHAKADMPRAQLKTALAMVLPKRLAEVLGARFGQIDQLANLPNSTLDQIAATLEAFTFRPTGTEGYAKAEVTAGGIDTDALSSKTMEVRDVPGLFFVGEAVDVTGWLGGYNFQWAWSSAVAAGNTIASRTRSQNERSDT